MYGTQGTYNVSLVVTNNNGCTDSTSQTILIHPSPTAAANASITEGCQSLPVQFSNSSTGATLYQWNFGNADTSSQAAPLYTYNQSGTFLPQLIVTNNFGCTDTVAIQPGIIVHATPLASFSTDTLYGCNPAPIQFIDQSTNLANPTYSWNFNNGTIAAIQNPSAIYSIAGTYTATLVVTNTFGCKDSSSQSITIYPSPTAAGLLSDSTGCSPLSVSFTNQSIGADSYNWIFGNGNSDTTANSINNYTTGGVYQPQLIAITNHGCRDSITLSPVTVLQSPVAAFTADNTSGCKNAIINFQDSSSSLQSPTYFWNFGNSTSTLQNPSVSYPYSGLYNVGLTVTNTNGCSDSVMHASYIEIFDSLPPPIDPIQSVSVKNNSEVEIIWDNSQAQDVSSYILYRYNPATGNFKKIMEVQNVSAAPLNSTTLYTDDSLDTRNSTYTYKLQTIDFCKNAYPLDSLTAHTTINITALQSGQNINVSWTPYVGCSVSSYELYRTEVSSGAVQLVAILPPATLNYTDTTLNCPFDYSYRVTATALCGDNYISLSDTSVARPVNIFAGQEVTVTRSTVINNKSVLTEWKPPVIHPERVAEYAIMRSDDNQTFSLIAKVPAAATAYVDDNVDVQKQEYYYRIAVVNDCSLSGDPSNSGSSIWLQGSKKDYESTFRWTHYKEWEFGVDQYVLQQMDSQGNWVDIKVVDSTITTVIVDE
jgi:PKD repeat protein